jgi:hypothetical protein
MRAIGQPGGIRMTDVIGKLTAEQALEIVERLYRKGGDMRDAVVAEAMNLLTQFSLDDIAEEVFDALDLIDAQDCLDQAGALRDGYTSPSFHTGDLQRMAMMHPGVLLSLWPHCAS